MLAHVINQTPFPHFAFEKLGYLNEHWFTVVIKATCDIDSQSGRCEFSDEQHPIIMADKYRTVPENSSLLTETDLIFHKPRGEFYITGTARTFDEQPISQWDAEFVIGSLQKKITLSGPRYWEYQHDWQLTEPSPISALPLIYEKAYGGKDINQKCFPKNPIGLGWSPVEQLNPAQRYCAPQITVPISNETLPDINTPLDVAGFGLYSRWWQQRQQYAGTYNQHWLDEIRPYYPADFKTDFLMAAPRDQQQENYFQGNETLTLSGLFAEALSTTFTLPNIGFVALQQTPNQPNSSHICHLDTLHLSLDERKLYLTWRYSQLALPADSILQLHAYKLQ